MDLGNLFLKLPHKGFTIVNISELIKCILLTVFIVNLNCFFFYIQFINRGMLHLETNKFYLVGNVYEERSIIGTNFCILLNVLI